MTLNELGNLLREMYDKAPIDDKVAMILLFGVKYADSIRAIDSSHKDIAIAAGIPESYGTEISKGVRLAKYVNLK